jgi:hypothetical protein
VTDPDDEDTFTHDMQLLKEKIRHELILMALGTVLMVGALAFLGWAT